MRDNEIESKTVLAAKEVHVKEENEDIESILVASDFQCNPTTGSSGKKARLTSQR